MKLKQLIKSKTVWGSVLIAFGGYIPKVAVLAVLAPWAPEMIAIGTLLGGVGIRDAVRKIAEQTLTEK